MKNWMKQIAVIVAWLGNIALAFWIMIVLHNTLLTALQRWYVGNSTLRSSQARAINQIYFAIAGVVCLIFIFAIDGYLRDGLKKSDMFRRFVKVAAIELLILFPAELLTSIAQRSFGLLSVLLMALELIGGAALLAYAIFNDPKRKKRLTIGEQA